MRSHRLSRLTLLTQGIALIGFGMSELACAKEQPTVNGPSPEPHHINAPPDPPASASAVPPGSELPHMNATATPPPSGSAAPSSSTTTTPPPVKPMPHTNAPRKP